MKLRFISFILGNEELFSKLNESFPPDFSEENIDTYLKYIQSCYGFSQFSLDFDFTGLVDFISRNFYLIDQEEFLKLTQKI